MRRMRGGKVLTRGTRRREGRIKMVLRGIQVETVVRNRMDTQSHRLMGLLRVSPRVGRLEMEEGQNRRGVRAQDRGTQLLQHLLHKNKETHSKLQKKSTSAQKKKRSYSK